MERVTASQRRRIQKLEPLRRGSLESGRESGTWALVFDFRPPLPTQVTRFWWKWWRRKKVGEEPSGENWNQGEEIPGADSWLCFSRARCKVTGSVRGHALSSADCRNREREAAGLQAQGWGSRAASVLGAAGGRRTQIAACAQDWWGSPGSTAASPGAVGAPQLSGAEAVPDGEWCTETRS